MLRACVPDYVQFGSQTECLQACAYYPPGSSGDITGNSRECRTAHATSAVGGEPLHCLHAGPFGYGGCGEMCEAFCQIVMPWCGPLAPFASNDACMSECLVWKWAPSMSDGTAAYRASGPTSGNTLDCREVMLVKSLDGPAAREQYCPLTGTNSTLCR